MALEIRKADLRDTEIVAPVAGNLFEEIMHLTGVRHFNVDLEKTRSLLRSFLEQGLYTVFLAMSSHQVVGFIALYESCSLYAGGRFGTIPELYVDPDHRSKGVGAKLLKEATTFGKEKGWTRLEVTTPPLPQFDQTLQFYRSQGFEITGGYKMKVLL